MAADSQVIKEFLVSLGFKIDQTGAKKFTEALDGTGKMALGVGKAVIGVGVAAQAMVAVFASSMEKLYYASKRTGSSVENLMGLESGSRRIGLAAGQAQEALEAMSGAVRMNPGLRAFMDSMLGKDTGKMDQAKAMLEFVQKISAMPHYAGARMAQMFGIDEKTFFMLKEGMPELLAAEQKHTELLRAAGIDATAAAEAGKEYSNSLRDIGDKMSLLGLKMSIELLPFFRKLNAEVNAILDATLKGGVGAGLGQAKKDLDDYHEAEYKKRHGGRSRAETTFTQDPVVWAMNKWRTRNDGKGKQSASGKITYPDEATSTAPAPPEASVALAPGGRQPIGIRQNNPGNLRSWGNTPRANGFAHFGTSQDGLSAMAGNLVKYAERGLTSVRDIIAKWAPANENNTAAYIEAVTKRLGVGAGDSLNLKDPAVLARLMGAMITQENGRNPYGSAEMLAAANGRLGRNGDGSKNVTIHQKTDIHVAGVSDANGAAQAVGRMQANVNGDMTRNFKGAVQ